MKRLFLLVVIVVFSFSSVASAGWSSWGDYRRAASGLSVAHKYKENWDNTGFEHSVKVKNHTDQKVCFTVTVHNGHGDDRRCVQGYGERAQSGYYTDTTHLQISLDGIQWGPDAY